MKPHLQCLFAAPWLLLQSLSMVLLLLEAGPVWAGVDIGGLILRGGRARIVQVCVVFMCLGLFILMRKWTETTSRRRTLPPAEPTEQD